jgi:putative PIN family toxin of toxin-antitoxin system
MRLVIDTNIWIHYLIKSSLERVDSLFNDPETEILLSQELLDELLEVSERKKFSRYFSAKDVSELFLLLESSFPLIDVHSRIYACRDERDNFLLTL